MIGVHLNGIHEHTAFRIPSRPAGAACRQRNTMNAHGYARGWIEASILDMSDYRLDGSARGVKSAPPRTAHAPRVPDKNEHKRHTLHPGDSAAVSSAWSLFSRLGGVRHDSQWLAHGRETARNAGRYGGPVHEDLCPVLDERGDRPSRSYCARPRRDDTQRLLRPAHSGVRKDLQGIVGSAGIF
jgi:hypothetical protein